MPMISDVFKGNPLGYHHLLRPVKCSGVSAFHTHLWQAYRPALNR